VQLQRPKLGHGHAALCDQLFGQGVTRTNALATLVISCWVRGLSDRDVEAMLVEVLGEQATSSRTTASRICQRLGAEFDAWRRRDLSAAKIDDLYLDGSFFKMHPKAKAEPVLAAWGIDTDGHAVFLGLGPGAAESTDAWRGFLEDLSDRGLGAPLLVISDTGKGLCTAIEWVLPTSLHQRCLVQVCRNLIAKVPTHAQGEVKRGRLGDLRPDRPRRRGRRRRGAPASQAVHRQVEAAVPHRGRLRGRQPRRARGPPAVPHRASQAHPALQPDRAHLRRPAAGSRSSAGCLVSRAASVWSGQCLTERPRAGVG
jgi:hypothetical protein